MEPGSFLSIEKPSKGLFKDKGSRFLSFAFPVSSEEEIKQILEELRKQYHDARHHCYAWRLGADMLHYRSNDDGEPTNSAGKPILGQIQSYQLTNILIVVVRYFGGTLLGVGGLIQAYKQASHEALESAVIVKQYQYLSYLLEFNYDDMNLVMRILKDMNLEQWGQDFKTECSLKVKVKLSEKNHFLEGLKHSKTIKLTLI